MRIFLLSLPILVHFLCLHSALGTTLPSGSTNPPVHPDDGVAGGSDVLRTAEATNISPSYILESIQNANLPLALRMTGIIQKFVVPQPSPPDFWEKAKEDQEILQEYIPRLLNSAAGLFKSIGAHITQAVSAMDNIVNATATLREGIQNTLDTHNITLDALTKELEGIFMVIVDDLEKIPAPDKAPSHAERTELVNKVLDDMTLSLENIAVRYGIEGPVETYISIIRPYVHTLIVAIGDINEQHPQLLPALLFSVVGLLIPESWLLRPFLSVFGFGPSGPVKGSAAAWLQRRLWGAAVAPGSWFAWLQAAGMGVIPKWSGYIVKLPWMIGALLAALLPCFYHG